MNYDAILVISFGGPEGPDDVMPFLENVLRGKNVPRERMLQVAEHYYRFGGKSPINDQNRSLITALKDELAQHGPSLPIWFDAAEDRGSLPVVHVSERQSCLCGGRKTLQPIHAAC